MPDPQFCPQCGTGMNITTVGCNICKPHKPMAVRDLSYQGNSKVPPEVHDEIAQQLRVAPDVPRMPPRVLDLPEAIRLVRAIRDGQDDEARHSLADQLFIRFAYTIANTPKSDTPSRTILYEVKELAKVVDEVRTFSFSWWTA